MIRIVTTFFCIAALMISGNSWRSPGNEKLIAGPGVMDPENGQLLFLPEMWKRIEVPHTYPEHPRLFLNAGEIEEIRTAAEKDERLTKVLSGIRVRADQVMDMDSGSSCFEDSRRARVLAQAYVFTDELKYAEKTAGILLKYADCYRGYPERGYHGKATTSTLEEAAWVLNICFAYDLIYNAGVLTESDKEHIEDDMLRPCAEILQECDHKTRSNWRSAAISGIAMVGFCIGDRHIVDQAVNGWVGENGRVKTYGFVQQLAGSILADGVWYERSMGYHCYSLGSLAQTAEAAKHSGLDLWHAEIESDGFDAGADAGRKWGSPGRKTLKCMFDALLYYTFDGKHFAQVANVGEGRLTSFNAPFALAWREYGDEKFAWMVSRGQEYERSDIIEYLWYIPTMNQGRFSLFDDTEFAVNGRIKNGCSLFPSGGYAVLRNNKPGDLSVLITYGKYGSGHDHPDKLHISLLAGRKMVLKDSPGSYGSYYHLNWSNQTIGHNTMVVDEISQYPQGDLQDPWVQDSWDKPSSGELVFYHPGTELKAVRAKCENAYEGVYLERTLALVDQILFDVYFASSGEEHIYDLAFHVDGESPDLSAVTSPARFSSERPGYKEITDVLAGEFKEKTVRIVYPLKGEDKDQLFITMLNCMDDKVVQGMGPTLKRDGIPLHFVRKHGRQAVFASVITLQATGRPEILVGPLEGLTGHITGIEIKDPVSDNYRVLLVSNDPVNLEYKGTSFDGRLALFDGQTGKLVDAVE